jgi:flagellar FliL protein
MKKKAAEAEAAEGEEGAAAPAKVQHAAPKPPPKTDKLVPPTFVPLDPFVVNLADRDADRYAQIGMTLEVEDAKFAESMKGYMPAIRNGILMILAHKTAGELLTREGKEQLAEEVAREAVRPMGIIIEDEEEYVDSKGRKKRRPPVYNPVQKVHFSNFIIQ